VNTRESANHAVKPWDIEDVDVVFLGAGFSACATDGQAPLMSTFFDRLDKSYPLLLEVLTREFGGPAKATVEEVNPSPPKPLTPARLESNFLSVDVGKKRCQEP
jgi:hypothetical protein